MKAAMFEEFGQPLKISNLSDPAPVSHGVVLEVKATGICRSDWHGWMGHDSDIKSLPYIPGHELSGIVIEIGKDVQNWKVGDRVTLPFVGGCGYCPECLSGNQQVCDNQFQPGFTHWGSFAQFVAIHYADINLVSLPESMDFTTTASLGCRFVTAFRAVVQQGKVRAGEWVAVFGCGGVGLSAIMIAKAIGARVIGVDMGKDKLNLARSLGADRTIDANQVANVAEAVIEVSKGGVNVSLDAIGNHQVCFDSISSLRKRGRHVQVGILSPEHHNPSIPMLKVMAWELEIVGSHGLQAYHYNDIFNLIEGHNLDLRKLISRTVTLEQSLKILENMNSFEGTGITVITSF